MGLPPEPVVHTWFFRRFTPFGGTTIGRYHPPARRLGTLSWLA